ncbi:hypothetical protein ES703_100548 [subsurface metagenome]
MVLNPSELTWTCHVCKRVRPDAKISVVTKPYMFDGVQIGKQNIRYCNDNPDCIAKAQDYSHFKEG